MSRCETTAGRKANLSGNGDFVLPSRMKRVFVTTVLMLCFVVPICGGQNNQDICGKRLVNHGYLIQQGEVSTRGHWPWHAVIFHRKQNIFKYKCGGSIIDESTILTAAHCVLESVHNILVHVGHVDLNLINTQQGYSVSKVIVHPNFADVVNDIAVLKVSNYIVMNDFVQPICLWSMDDDHGQIVGKTGTVVGFGLDEDYEVSTILQETTLTVVDGYECAANDRAYGISLTPNVYCAGGKNGATPCNGDSGGGMFFENGGTWYVRGIVSFSAKQPNTTFCDPSKYTVFTFISKYITWIQSVVTRKSLTHLEPCKGSVIRKDIMCNVANRFDHDFLLAGQVNNISRVPLNRKQSFSVSTTSGSIALDRDCAMGRFYWSNHGTEEILSAKYDGTDQKPFTTKNAIFSNRLAVDWISRRLYWADWRKNTIEVASLDNPNDRTVLIYENLDSPWAIAVDPLQSKLYWSNSYHKKEKIEWSNLDGSRRQVLVSSPQIESIVSIQVSMATEEICYTDDGIGKIGCIDPYNKQIRTIAGNLIHPWTLAVTDELFYWTEWDRDTIESINQNGVRQKPIYSQDIDFSKSNGMTAVTDKCPLFYSPCAIKNGDCPANTICLVNPSAPADRSCIVKQKCKETDQCSELIEEN